MMEMIIIVQSFPKRQFTSIALVLWSHFGSGQFIACHIRDLREKK